MIDLDNEVLCYAIRGSYRRQEWSGQSLRGVEVKNVDNDILCYLRNLCAKYWEFNGCGVDRVGMELESRSSVMVCCVI